MNDWKDTILASSIMLMFVIACYNLYMERVL